MDPRVQSLAIYLRARYWAFMAREAWILHSRQRDIIVSAEGVKQRGNAYTGHASFSSMLPLIDAYRAAKAIVHGHDKGLTLRIEDECDPWDGDSPAPAYLFHLYVPDPVDSFPIASLGMVGVNSLDDPYLDIVKGELFAEALRDIDEREDLRATRDAAEMAERATYAGVAS